MVGPELMELSFNRTPYRTLISLSLEHNLFRPPIIDLPIMTSSDPRSSTFRTYISIHPLALTMTSLDYTILSTLEPLVDLFALLPTLLLNPNSVPLKRCTFKGKMTSTVI